MNNAIESLLTFDIGGTWTRFGIDDGFAECKLLDRIATPSYANGEQNSEHSRAELIQLIRDQIDRFTQHNHNTTIQNVAISLGAALNGNTGTIYFSGPLWGSSRSDNFDFSLELKHIFPAITFHIVNDITAHLLWYIRKNSNINSGKTVLITLSTGIGCRTFDHDSKSIPLDADFGIQGEIGHLPTTPTINGRSFEAVCDCGGENHLSAFCSGSGVVKHWQQYRNLILQATPNSAIRDLSSFDSQTINMLIRDNDAGAKLFIAALVQPIGNLILTMLTMEPAIKEIALTGGLLESLQPNYLCALQTHLNKAGLYIISDFDRSRVPNLIHVTPECPVAGMGGAAMYYREFIGNKQ